MPQPLLDYYRTMFGLGVWELVVILMIVLLLFGVKRLPQLGSSLGQGIKNFTKSFKDEETGKQGSSDNSKSDDAAELKSSDEAPRSK